MDASTWAVIAGVIRDEFSDIADLGQLVRLLVRLSMALVLGFLLGYERQAHGKAAGVRTHMLLCMGSALFVMIPLQFSIDRTDMSRVMQGLMAGVGFLCAGTIIKQDKAADIKGLTTAAGLWLTAAVGMACGLGRELTAIVSALLALAVLALVPHIVTGSGPGAQRDELDD